MPATTKVKGLKERLDDGEIILCAEGYVFEAERRGYLKAGTFVPEVVLEHPEVVRAMHEEFVHAGSDVVEAFTYYGHREKMRHIDAEDAVEKLNRAALRIARDVADRTGTLMAGNICNTAIFDKDPKNPATISAVKEMFKEQVTWAVEERADFIIGETFVHYGEAELALEAIQKYGKGLPAVINLAAMVTKGTIEDAPDFAIALEKLKAKGALIVGLNCSAGPQTMTKHITEIRKTYKGPLASLPVPYRTDDEHPVMFSLQLPEGGGRAFFPELDHFYAPQQQIRTFGEAMKTLNVQFIGLCCGNSARHFRALAESVGRTPPASRYTHDMSKHYILGNDAKIKAGVEDIAGMWEPVSKQKAHS